MKKKLFMIIAILVLPLAILFGAASWLIYTDVIFSPVYDSTNVLAAYFEDNQEVTYNGAPQSPSYETLVESPDDSVLSYSYADKNVFNLYTDASFTNGKPVNAGTYWVKITPNVADTNPLYVTYKINKATPVVQTNVSVTYPDSNNCYTTSSSKNSITYSGTYVIPETSTVVPGTITCSDSKALTIGTSSYQYKFTPDDTSNFNVVTGTCDIVVKATVKAYNGTTQVGTYYVAKNASFTLPSTSSFTKTGYDTLGWKDSSGNALTSPMTITSDTSIYVNYNPITYTITYDLAGGSVSGTNKTTYTIETPTFTLINPTKSGATFAGWTGTNVSSAVTTLKVTQGTTGNLSFTAHWKCTAKFYKEDKTTLIGEYDVIDGEVTSPTYLAVSDYQYRKTFEAWKNIDDDAVVSTNAGASVISGIDHSIELYASVTSSLMSYTVNVYYKDKDNQISTLRTNSTDGTSSGGWTGGTTATYFTTQVYDFVTKVGVTTSTKTFGDSISLSKQVRIAETYYYYSAESTSAARYIQAFYMSQLDSFDWNLLLDSTFVKSGVGVNDKLAVYVSGTTLNIVVLCVQPAAIVSTGSITGSTNTNYTGVTYYADVNDAFDACKNVSSTTYLRPYGAVYHTNTFTSNVNTYLDNRNVLTANQTINAYKYTIGGYEYSFPKYTISFDNWTLNKNYTIPSKLNVILPYGANDTSNTGYVTQQTAIDAVSYAYVDSVLCVGAGTTLTVNGTLTVGGYVYSTTVGSHGVLMNNGTIVVNSTLNSYGYTKGTGHIELVSGATATDVFKIYNWPGGANAMGLNNKNVFPFEAYSFHNISCEIKINKGAKYQAWAQLYMASTWATAQNIVLVGSGGLFDITDSNGYLVKSVEETTTDTKVNTSYTSSNVDVRQRDVLDIYGSFKDNSISVTAKVLASTTIKTSTSMALPLGFARITIKSGTGTLSTNSYKFLPGSSLTVDQGAKLVIGNGVKCIFYDSYDEDYGYDSGSGTSVTGYANTYSYVRQHVEYYKAYGALDSSNALTYTHTDGFGSKLVVNGTLESNGSLAGNIYSTVDNASISIAAASVSATKLTQLTYGRTGSSASTTTETLYPKANLYNTTTSSINETLENVPTGVYYSTTVDGKTGFASMANANTFTLQYNTNGADETVSTFEKKSIQSTVQIEESDLPVINKKGYSFGGWYVDSSFNTPALGYTLTSGSTTTLYAKWTMNTYSISYNYVYDDCSSMGSVTNTNPTTFNINSTIDLVDATDGTLVFNGWFIDEDCSVAFPKITSSTLSAYINLLDSNGGILELYGLFSDKHIYSVTYFDAYNNIDTENLVSVTEGNSITLLSALDPYRTTSGFDTNTYTYINNVFSKWRIYDTNGTSLGDYNAGAQYTPTCNVYIRPIYTQVNYSKISVTVSNATVTITGTQSDGESINKSFSSSGSIDIITGTSVTVKTTYSESDSQSVSIKTASGSSLSTSTSYTGKLNANWVVNASSEASSCITADTLVYLADGSQKYVSELTTEDLVLVFNHNTGKVEASVIIADDENDAGYDYYDVLYLAFEDGSIVKVIYEHGFFDVNLLKYVQINYENYNEFIGHYYLKTEYIDGEFVNKSVKLVDAYVVYEWTKPCSPCTAGALNFYANGFLSMTAGLDGMYNFFEINSDFAYDEEQMIKDIEQYGLYTYDDFKDYISYEVYLAIPFEYLKVSVGKGLITYETIIEYIEMYLYGNGIY